MSQMKWYILDPAEAEQSPYELSGDQMDLLVKDLEERLGDRAILSGESSLREIVADVLDILEVWHG